MITNDDSIPCVLRQAQPGEREWRRKAPLANGIRRRQTLARSVEDGLRARAPSRVEPWGELPDATTESYGSKGSRTMLITGKCGMNAPASQARELIECMQSACVKLSIRLCFCSRIDVQIAFDETLIKYKHSKWVEVLSAILSKLRCLLRQSVQKITPGLRNSPSWPLQCNHGGSNILGGGRRETAGVPIIIVKETPIS